MKSAISLRKLMNKLCYSFILCFALSIEECPKK
jgi:hypothetical protein